MQIAFTAAGGVLALSGALSTTSAVSPVTSATRTVVGGGTFLFTDVGSDSGTPQYSKNADAYSNITEGMTLAVAANDTLAVRATLPTPGQNAGFNLKNNAGGGIIEAVSLDKT